MVVMGQDKKPMDTDLLSPLKRDSIGSDRASFQHIQPLLVPLRPDRPSLGIREQFSLHACLVLGFSAESANTGPSCAGGFCDVGTCPF